MTPPNYEKLYNKHYQNTFRLLRLKNIEEEIAKDLNQEIWKAAFENLSQLKDPRLFKAWLNKILLSVVSNHFRSEGSIKRGGDFKQLEIDQPELIPEDNNNSLEDQEWMKRLATCWTKLSTLKQQIMSMVADQSSPNEIAIILRTNSSTVRSHIKQSRQQLGQCMSSDKKSSKNFKNSDLDVFIRKYAKAQLVHDEHLEEETLKFFITDLLDDNEIEEVREHLSICGHCRSKWRELMFLDSLIQEELAESDPQPQDSSHSEPPTTVIQNDPKPTLLQNYGFYLLAAAIAFSAIYGPLSKKYTSTPTTIEAPVNAPTFSLEPVSRVTRNEAASQTVINGATPFTLQLIYVEETPITAYAAAIRKQGESTTLIQIDGLKSDPMGTFTIYVPGFAPGEYSVDLIGDSEIVQSYPFVVE